MKSPCLFQWEGRALRMTARASPLSAGTTDVQARKKDRTFISQFLLLSFLSPLEQNTLILICVSGM